MERRLFLAGIALASPLLGLTGWAAGSKSARLLANLQHLTDPELVDADPRGPRVVVGCGLGKSSGSILLLERQSGKELWSIATRGLRDCCLCDQGRLLFVATPDGWTLWDTVGYRPRAQVRLLNRAAGINRDGSVIVCQSDSPVSGQGVVIRIYDGRGKLLDTFAGGSDKYQHLTVNSDGDHFALWNKDGFLLYDVPDRVNFAENTGSVAFHPEGRSLVRQSAAGWMVELAVDSGAALNQPVQTHTGGAVSFSPDGKLILTQGVDPAGHHWAQLWHYPKLEPVCSHIFSPGIGSASQSAFSGDGKAVVSWNPDGQVEVWSATSGTLIGEAPSKLPSPLASVAVGQNWLVAVGGKTGKGFYRCYSW